MIDIHSIVSALQHRGCDPHQAGDEWRAKCPCHNGATANSLAISEDAKMYCHSCKANTGDVLKELGLAEDRRCTPKVTIDGKQVTLHDSEESAINAVKWSVFRNQLDISPRPPDRRHQYHDREHNHIFTVVIWKYSTERKEARQIRKYEDGWICKAMKADRPLYHLPDVIEASSVIVCEGEKTADALRSIGLVATTPSQGAMSPSKTDWSVLTGKSVTITVDNDDAGREFAKRVIDLLPESVVSVKVVELNDDWPELPIKGDAADWVEHFANVEYAALRNRFDALPDHFATINAIVPKKKRRERVATESEAGRPEIELTLNEKRANDLVIAALGKREDMFDHYGHLAVIINEQVDGEESRKTIQHLKLATLRELISESCKFYELSMDKDTQEHTRLLKRIPRWCYEAVLSRGTWPGIRPIRGIVTSPVLRADGSVLQAQGYDTESGLYVDLTEVFPPIDSAPSADDVQRAVATLFDVVVDFPFRDDASKSAWLASLLTPLVREAYRGCTGPLFLFDANVRGSGKSLLADINSLIVTGREATRMPQTQNDEEMRKRITALVMDSDRIVLIDNISGQFGCPSLDAALTGTIWKDRLLKSSETIEAPLKMTWYGSGNNVILAADTARRVCHIRLESPLENPEDRDEFKYPDIRKHVRQNRAELLTAALTIHRGYIAAGRPDQRLKPWGSFEGWSDLARGAIVWSGLADPGETRTALRATSDSEAGALRQMLNAVVRVDPAQSGLRTSDMLKIANGQGASCLSSDRELMREAIEALCGRSLAKVNAQYLGNQLKHVRNRVIDQMAFDCTLRQGTNYWFVRMRGGPGGPGGPDSAEPSACENTDVQLVHSEIPRPSLDENRSTTSTRSTTTAVPVITMSFDLLREFHLRNGIT